MMKWQSIATAPKDGSRILCWRLGWEPPGDFLIWKTNERIVRRRKYGEDVGDMMDSYFGDPYESDDYDLAKPENAPTHWLPITVPIGDANV